MDLAALFRVAAPTILWARHGHRLPERRRMNQVAWVRPRIASLNEVLAAPP